MLPSASTFGMTVGCLHEIIPLADTVKLAAFVGFPAEVAV